MTCKPAPEEILELISCTCRKCDTSCSCSLHNLSCTDACKSSNCDNIFDDIPSNDFHFCDSDTDDDIIED